ncbi:MAG: 3-ketoacyl-ACP reductase [Promethearchaeota archaeon]
MDVYRKTALVTGSRRGIGRAIGVALTRAGYDVAFHGASPDLPADVRNEVGEARRAADLDGPPRYVAADLSSAPGVDCLVEWMERNCPRLDVLVNNAGVAPRRRVDLLEADREDFARVLQVNLVAPFFLSVAAAKLMLRWARSLDPGERARYKPKIVNVTSVSAYASSPERASYCISKAGLSMATRLFADRLAADGVLVYEVRPGVISTDMTRPVAKKYDRLIGGGLTPIARWGTPEDVAAVVVAICSGAFDFSTGEAFNVDGGFHLRRL